MTRTPSRTRTRTTRSTEHAAHRPLMHSVHIALWLKIASCVSSHPCMRTCVLCLDCFLLAFLVFYLVSLFHFQPFLMSTSAPNERSRSNPLCNSSLGSVVTSDYDTPHRRRRRRRRRYSPCSRSCAGFAWRSGCRAQCAARSAGEGRRRRACVHAHVMCILRVFMFMSLHLLLMWFVSCLSSVLVVVHAVVVVFP